MKLLVEASSSTSTPTTGRPPALSQHDDEYYDLQPAFHTIRFCVLPTGSILQLKKCFGNCISTVEASLNYRTILRFPHYPLFS